MMSVATVVVCTHNRAALLGRTLDRALEEVRTADGELLVVDNASTDDTAAVLAARAGLRAVREPILGLSQARNRGVTAARADLLVFLDDDAVPRRGWLPALLAPFADPAVACVGGRILLDFAVPPPAWLTAPLHGALSAYDLGDESRRVPAHPGEQYPVGANIAFRRSAIERLGGFSTEMGLRGPTGLQKEETDLCFRIERAGDEIRYAARAVVDHHVSRERLTPEWFLARVSLSGRSNAFFELKNRGVHRALGLMRWHYAPLLAVRRYRPREPIDPDRFYAECMRREALGYLRGLATGIPRLAALRREAGVAVAT
jgi:GT2 family glycosyltransferase